MIVLPHSSGLLIFRQPDHAVLSARAASAWRRPEAIPPSMWPRFLEAVRRHDEGWIEEERRPALDPQGKPYDFKTLPRDLHVDAWRRGVELVLEADPYIGILVARHSLRLFEMLRTEFSSLAGNVLGFPAEMESRIDRERARLLRGSPDERVAAEPGALLRAQLLLSFFDGLSLMLLGAIPLSPRTARLAFGKEESELQIEGDREEFFLRPWPFEAPAVTLEMEGVRLPKTRFAAPEELAREMARAPAEKLRWQLSPSGRS